VPPPSPDDDPVGLSAAPSGLICAIGIWKLKSGAKTKVRAAFLPLGASLVAARRLPGASLRARCAPAGSRRDGKQVDGWWERQGLRRGRPHRPKGRYARERASQRRLSSSPHDAPFAGRYAKTNPEGDKRLPPAARDIRLPPPDKETWRPTNSLLFLFCSARCSFGDLEVIRGAALAVCVPVPPLDNVRVL